MSKPGSTTERERWSSADVEQLEFVTEEIRGHAEDPSIREGHLLTKVAGARVPEGMRLSYVTGRLGEERFQYVVLWKTPNDQEGQALNVDSVSRAKALILDEFRRLVGL